MIKLPTPVRVYPPDILEQRYVTVYRGPHSWLAAPGLAWVRFLARRKQRTEIAIAKDELAWADSEEGREAVVAKWNKVWWH